MARSTPSMTALLGLLAIAGYQNRDKIGDLIGKARQALGGADRPGGTASAPVGELERQFDEQSAGGTLSSGLNDVFEQFNQSGQGDAVGSWVGKGQNKPLDPQSLQTVVGDDTLDELSAKLGLSKADILARLSSSLPSAVDAFTPDGRLPNAAEASRFR